MALYTITGTPPVWPKVHSRSFYPTTQQGRNAIRRYPRYHVPRGTASASSSWQYFQAGWAEATRGWTRIIGGWWAANNVPNGKTWWETLAAANPLINYKGQSVIVKAYQWFLFYQRAAIHQAIGISVPLYLSDYPSPTAPDLPWAPAPPPTLISYEATAPHHLRLTVSVTPDGTEDLCALSWFALHDKTAAALPLPHYQTNSNFSTAPGNDLVCDFTHNGPYPPARPGHRARAALAQWTVSNKQPGQKLWLTFNWE
jgi:hypothetical protein